MPGRILGSGGKAVNKTDENSWPGQVETLEQHHPVELSTMMEMFYVRNCPRVAVEHLKWD